MRSFLLFLICSSFHLIGNEPFYALSSLKFFLGQGNECAIPYEESDIRQLWKKAALSGDPDIAKAREYYEKGYTEESCQYIDRAWYRFQGMSALGIYSNFDDNRYLSEKIKEKIRPYLLPQNHPIKARLDAIFSKSHVILNESNFSRAGFITKEVRPESHVRLAFHPDIPGYLFKVYLDNEKRTRSDQLGWECLLLRCQGAKNIRDLIKKKGIRHFVVPDKWLYPFPEDYRSKNRQPIFLIATYMDLVPKEECKMAWKSATREVLDELYSILSHGYGSDYLVGNIPYTRDGKFAFIDTEYPKRQINYSKATDFFSKPMQKYWEQLVRNGGK